MRCVSRGFDTPERTKFCEECERIQKNTGSRLLGVSVLTQTLS